MAPTALGAHLAELMLHARPDTAQINGDHLVEALGRLIGWVASEADDAGIVEGHVQPAVGRDGALDHLGDLHLIRHSQVTPMAWWPSAVNPSVARRSASSSMSASTTAAPASAKAFTLASPMPELAPVTRATWPLKS
jgi:hypothetical protein